MSRFFPKQVVISMDPATFVALFFFTFLAVIGALFIILG